ncbi:MAG: glutamine--fructose-6-phosphate transaminase (isomerizing), partial [Thermodesulfobacteriota bacterium]
VFLEENNIKVIKKKGKILDLEERIFESQILKAKAPGLGHTRWATHGEPSEENAHPHLDCSKTIALVHNGIIENYYILKEKLLKNGHNFTSTTDTEVIVHLIEEHLKQENNLKEAFRNALRELEGAYAIGVMFKNEPDKLFAARNQSPLVIGLGENENFIASDIPALLPFTRKVIILEDGEFAILTKEEVKVFNLEGEPIHKEPILIQWDLAQAEKGGFPHFMLKEIYEQPEAVKHTLLGRINLDNGIVDFSREGLTKEFIEDTEKIFIVACGTSYHAGLVGKYILEKYINIPVEVDLASEFRYRVNKFSKNAIFIAISQSGETADTLASLRIAKEKGAKILSICNVLGSSIARESNVVLYTQAGPEISVASTKAFTTQVTILILLAIYMEKLLYGKSDHKEKIEAFIKIPSLLQNFMGKVHPKIKEIARKWYQAKDFLYLGRNILFPIALEGALKLKEIAYIHAEGYAAGEMKHGPIALIEENVPTVILAAKETGIVYEKTLSNAEEVRSRRGPIIGIVSENSKEIKRFTDDYIEVPFTLWEALPIFYVIPLQLLAYEIATLRGCDVDKPRNLAKSVTVE